MITLDKHHVILYAVAIVLSLGVTYLVESRQAQQAEQRYEVLKAQSDAKDAANTQFQVEVMQKIEELTSQNQQLQTQNAEQNKIVAALTTKLQVQKTSDAALPPSGLASRIHDLVPDGNVTVLPDGYKLDQTEAVAVTQALEEPPVLRQQLVADQVIITNDQATIANDAKILDTEKASGASALDAKSADLAAANQQITALKASSRKGKLKWFGIGYAAGFGSAMIMRVLTLK